MDQLVKSVYSTFFFDNPVFFIDVSRVIAGISCCSLPQQCFDVSPVYYTTLEIALSEYLHGRINAERLFSAAESVERELLRNLKENELYPVAETLGIKIVPVVSFLSRVFSEPQLQPDIQFYACLKRESVEEWKKVEMEILKGEIDLKRGWKEILSLEGSALGYPDCCVKNYVESKGTFPAENAVILDMIESEEFASLLTAIESNKVVAYPYLFTSNFYPCSVRCKKARKIGELIEFWLEGIGEAYAFAFKVRTMINALYILSTAYSAYTAGATGKFGERLKSFFIEIDARWMELLESVHTHMRRLTTFTNMFIRRMHANSSKSSHTAKNEKN